MLYSWFFFKIIKYIIYFKYILNMVGRVEFGGFVILWPIPNPTRYNFFFFITQPNPPSLKNQPNPPGRVWRVSGFFAHPYMWYSLQLWNYLLCYFVTISSHVVIFMRHFFFVDFNGIWWCNKCQHIIKEKKSFYQHH